MVLLPSILSDDEYPARLMDPRAVLLTCSCGKRAVLKAHRAATTTGPREVRLGCVAIS